MKVKNHYFDFRKNLMFQTIDSFRIIKKKISNKTKILNKKTFSPNIEYVK